MTELSEEKSIAFCPIRLGNVTATEMAAVLGVNAYSSPAKIREQKLNPVNLVGNHLRRGKLREPSVLEAFWLDMRLKAIRHEGGSIKHPHHRIAATPDAIEDGTGIVVECKSIMTKNFDKWYTTVPTYYQMQVMVQAFVMDVPYGIIGALEEGCPDVCEYDFVAWRIDRSDEIEQYMKEETERFFEHMDAGKAMRASSKVKARVLELLPDLAVRIYPNERPKRRDSKNETLSELISLFK